jgi:hydroxymethylpyrimidine/phosphomethylpyrimidine kinase
MSAAPRLAQPIALTIAGLDPSGGAGLAADLKTFHQHRVYGAAVASLITVQNTQSVTRVDVLDPQLVREQLVAVMSDLRPHAVKTGALGNEAVIDVVARYPFDVPLVVDPVMVSKHGHALLAPAARRALLEKLLPVTTVLTPNTQEAAVLLGTPVETVEDAERAAQALSGLGPKSVLVKGGHLGGPQAVDVLWHQGRIHRFFSERVDTRHTHGTGCTFSAAITAWLAHGRSLPESVREAKAWLTRALSLSPDVGQGIGPVNHLAPLKVEGDVLGVG